MTENTLTKLQARSYKFLAHWSQLTVSFRVIFHTIADIIEHGYVACNTIHNSHKSS
jgi:hypothetical protein